ncbi:hypothetical protein D3C87_805980 [compost metagenome]
MRSWWICSSSVLPAAISLALGSIWSRHDATTACWIARPSRPWAGKRGASALIAGTVSCSASRRMPRSAFETVLNHRPCCCDQRRASATSPCTSPLLSSSSSSHTGEARCAGVPACATTLPTSSAISTTAPAGPLTRRSRVSRTMSVDWRSTSGTAPPSDSCSRRASRSPTGVPAWRAGSMAGVAAPVPRSTLCSSRCSALSPAALTVCTQRRPSLRRRSTMPSATRRWSAVSK